MMVTVLLLIACRTWDVTVTDTVALSYLSIIYCHLLVQLKPRPNAEKEDYRNHLQPSFLSYRLDQYELGRLSRLFRPSNLFEHLIFLIPNVFMLDPAV